ncbi:MAG: phenylalanine--tRNA ligase subunit beta, partial [Candidatus Parvarchaeota archaeon]|nr:phenylalanine--tRNA ligase subunit beta [Candidatus Haiyanarchaeum thermophilum]
MKLEIDRSQLMDTIGVHIPDEELVKFLRRLKIEVEELGPVLKLELADTNRVELVSLRGIARELGRMLGRAPKKYAVKSYSLHVFVDEMVGSIRPYIATSVIKGIKLNDLQIKELIQVQERLDATIGRNRKVTSIGLYDFSKIRPPIYYKIAPSTVRFVPLGFEEEMSLAEILELHPKGKEYGWILASTKVYPLLTDSLGQVLSFPPIINSNDLGRVTENTRDILVEVTGTSLKSVERVLKIMSMDLIDMGGVCYGSIIHYPRSLRRSPIFQDRKISFNPEHFWKKSGVKLSIPSLRKLLKFSGFNLLSSKRGYQVQIPFYREDVMDEVDVIEEILLHYGYENLTPEPFSLPTTGKVDSFWEFLNEVREVLIGLGFHEILSFTLTNPQMLFDQMNVKRNEVVELLNPITSQFSCLRNSILPSLLEFSSRNKRYFYPQKLFEI